MAYVLNADLTDTYIQSLMTRNGFTNTASEHPEWGFLYVFKDLNGLETGFSDMPSARDWLIEQYVIIQNS